MQDQKVAVVTGAQVVWAGIITRVVSKEIPIAAGGIRSSFLPNLFRGFSTFTSCLGIPNEIYNIDLTINRHFCTGSCTHYYITISLI